MVKNNTGARISLLVLKSLNVPDGICDMFVTTFGTSKVSLHRILEQWQGIHDEAVAIIWSAYMLDGYTPQEQIELVADYDKHAITKVGDYGVSISGMSGVSVAGDYGVAWANFQGKAIAGKYGLARNGGGREGISIAMLGGSAIAAELGYIIIQDLALSGGEYIMVMGSTMDLSGENMQVIEPNVEYIARYGKLVKKESKVNE